MYPICACLIARKVSALAWWPSFSSRFFSFCRFSVNLPLRFLVCRSGILSALSTGRTRSFFYIFNHIFGCCLVFLEHTRVLQMSFFPPSHQLFLGCFPTRPGFEFQILGVAPSFSMFQQVHLHFQFNKKKKKKLLNTPSIPPEHPSCQCGHNWKNSMDEPLISDRLNRSWAPPSDRSMSPPLQRLFASSQNMCNLSYLQIFMQHSGRHFKGTFLDTYSPHVWLLTSNSGGRNLLAFSGFDHIFLVNYWKKKKKWCQSSRQSAAEKCIFFQFLLTVLWAKFMDWFKCVAELLHFFLPHRTLDPGSRVLSAAGQERLCCLNVISEATKATQQGSRSAQH